MLMSEEVDAAVAHAGEEISLDRFGFDLLHFEPHILIGIVHDVVAFLFVAQKLAGEKEQLLIVLLKEPFESKLSLHYDSFKVCCL